MKSFLRIAVLLSAIGAMVMVIASFSGHEDQIEAAQPKLPVVNVGQKSPLTSQFSVLGDVPPDLLESKSDGFISSLISWSGSIPGATLEPLTVSAVGTTPLAGGAVATVVEIGDYVCQYVDGGVNDGSGGCASFTQLMERGTFGVTPDMEGGLARVLGMVSDEVVRIVPVGEPELATEVTGNVFQLSLPQHDTTLIGAGENGEEVLRMNLPLEFYASADADQTTQRGDRSGMG